MCSGSRNFERPLGMLLPPDVREVDARGCGPGHHTYVSGRTPRKRPRASEEFGDLTQRPRTEDLHPVDDARLSEVGVRNDDATKVRLPGGKGDRECTSDWTDIAFET